MTSRMIATAVVAALVAAAPAAFAQSVAPAPSQDPVAALLGPAPQQDAAPAATPRDAETLEQGGEADRPAPDAEQNPAEVSLTQRLNTRIAERNELADQTDQGNQAEHEAAVSAYREESADVEAERERIDIDTAINAQSRAEYDAEQQDRYDKAMADWRATVAACEANHTARCRAGSQPALPGT